MTDPGLNRTIDRLAEPVFSMSRWLTKHPETGGEEKESSAYIIRFLEEQGYVVERDYCGLSYSFRAYRPSCRPRIAVLCEYDALPEIGHGCGHSLSCGVSVLSALAVRECFPELPCEIDLIGTPGEENIGGKVILSQRGGFDRYRFAVMGHMDTANIPQWRVLACSDLYITIRGKAVHASAAPWEGRSALNAAQLFLHGIDMDRMRHRPFMQIHGIMAEGGRNPGTIPDLAVLSCYLRAASLTELEELQKDTIRMLKGTTYATQTDYTVEQRWGTLAELHYGRTAVRMFLDIFRDLGMEAAEMKYPKCSTDAGNVDLVIPVFHPGIKAADISVNLHTAEFEQCMHGDRAVQTLKNGAKVIGNFLWQTAGQESVMKQLTEEWKSYRGL
ncbi:MAG: M20 family metallopeptidase [Lachnospiraceae bacterium]|jgi:amidohydrolase|nr:M20 family metallopeptidase [Lachnospiraceae bacterium]